MFVTPATRPSTQPIFCEPNQKPKAMKKLLTGIIVILLSGICAFADDLRKRAGENPLDCAIYLVTKDRLSKFDLEWILFETGRYNDYLRFVDKTDSYWAGTLAVYSSKIREKNKTVEAGRYLDIAIEILRNTGDIWYTDGAQLVARELAAAGRDEEALQVLEHQEEDSERAEVLVKIAEGYKKGGQPEKAVRYLSEAWKLSAEAADPGDMLDIARLYMDLGQTGKLREVLSAFEKENASSAGTNQDRLYLEAASMYVRLGELEKASTIWQVYRDADEGYDTFSFASALIAAGYNDKAEPMLLQLRADKEFLGQNGDRLAKIYLDRGDLETAKAIAMSISARNDSYAQQTALMNLADKLISTGNRDGALRILDIAIGKARNVGEEHNAMDSTSPLIRKVIYLREIRRRYFNLGLFDKGLALADAIKVNHRQSYEFRSQGLLDYTELQLKSLSRKNLDRILKQAEDVFDKKDDDNRNDARLRIVKIYARAGDKVKALEILNAVLAYIAEDPYVHKFLSQAGKTFEESRLQPNDQTRKLLKEIIEQEVGE